MSEIFTSVQIVLPDVSRNYFYRILAICTFTQMGACFADCARTLVLPITISIRCGVGQDLMCRAKIVVLGLIEQNRYAIVL